MKDKPVAYGMLTFCKNCGEQNPYAVKELTDEEIKDIWCEVYDFKSYDCLTKLDYKFCREIIRKAQEK